ncbi:ArsR/SmtB family transcription factor [Rhizobium herbae]|uniref:DNA-binding transcriptional ArsR family regulator n=1 Tax=Rhizobium herbae TaxID=508661 RepID=A0ABS4EUL7_9HYPH|nr:helix-turn-helix domain-containing protein [Rhizobium herbae]MBP1861649.1 DNA-binding transcriptional ArsR family regulator [Rhizobium herbae]
MKTLDGPALDEALRALSHPDRRLFVKACQSELRAAGDLAALSELSLATVSEHLKVLRKSGLLILSKQGRFWLYRTDIGALQAVANAVAQLEGT